MIGDHNIFIFFFGPALRRVRIFLGTISPKPLSIHEIYQILEEERKYESKTIIIGLGNEQTNHRNKSIYIDAGASFS